MTPATKTLGSGQMFDGIAARYDLVNRVISLGIDQSWRRRTVRALKLSEGARVLDLATGTGDLALLIARAVPTAHVVGLDPSSKMLEIASAKVAQAGLAELRRLARLGETLLTALVAGKTVDPTPLLKMYGGGA